MGSREYGSAGCGIVNSIAVDLEQEKKLQDFRSRNVTCLNCDTAKQEAAVLDEENHGLTSTEKITHVHDMKFTCDRNREGKSKLSCSAGVRSADPVHRCDRCIRADRCIDAEYSTLVGTRKPSTVVTKTKLFHCKLMGKNDYCYPYFRCDKFKPLGGKE